MIRIFKIFVPTSILALLLSEFVLLLACYATALFLWAEFDPEVFLFYDAGILRILFAVVVELMGLYVLDLYSDLRVRSRILIIQQICLAIGVAFISQALLSYVSNGWIVPRLTMIYGSTLALVFLPAWRILYSRFVLGSFGRRRILFLGDSESLDELAYGLEDRPELGFTVAGYVNDLPDNAPAFTKEGLVRKQLGTFASLREIVRETKPDALIVGMAERRARLPVNDLLDLRFEGLPVMEVSSLYEAAFGRVCTRELRPSQLIFSEEMGPDPTSVFAQRVYSFVIAAVLVILTAPVMVLVALAVRISSRGPVLYRQIRVGLHGEPFTVFKFRTMREDAEQETGAVWAVKNDPRITPLGRFLRKSRLDELPQLLNVLRGEMSIAGPRPERPEFVTTLSEKIPFYRQRHAVKPGITGWAQISYKYGDSIEDTIKKLEFDLYYIKHLSWSLDVYIYFHTFKTMLLSRGAQ
jgi:sugar transferase (PEP-CTERM system associated)